MRKRVPHQRRDALIAELERDWYEAWHAFADADIDNVYGQEEADAFLLTMARAEKRLGLALKLEGAELRSHLIRVRLQRYRGAE